jgi:malate/lactate dehydrogenase
MRRTVTCTAATRTGEVAALLIAQLDLSTLVLVGGPDGLADDVAGAALAQGYEPRIAAGGWADAAGSDLVVVDAVDAAVAREIATRCAGAIVVVASADVAGDVEALLAATQMPPARVLGAAVQGAGPVTAAARATELVDAILRDRRRVLDVAVQGPAQDGAAGGPGVAVRAARVGAGGVQELA